MPADNVNDYECLSLIDDPSHLADQLRLAADHLRTNGPSLEERYSWLEAMINHVPDYIYAKDRQGRFLFANEAVIRNNGLSRMEDLIGRTDTDLHTSSAAAEISEIERRVIETGVPDLGFEEPALKGGPDRWLMMSRVPLKDDDGQIIGVVGASRDITARKASERLMSAQAQLLEMIVASVPLDKFIPKVAQVLEEIGTDIKSAVLLVKQTNQLEIVACPSLPNLNGMEVSLEDIPAAFMQIDDAAHHLYPNLNELKFFDIRSSNGELHGLIAVSLPWQISVSGIIDFLFSSARIVGIAIDRNRYEEQIRFLAEHDALTGLPTRLRFDKDLSVTLRRAQLLSKRVAVAFMDIDNFKLVNDSLGHEAGDELLKIISARLCISVGDRGAVARIGGDEFVIVLHDADEDFTSIIAQIRADVTKRCSVSGIDLQATASIGVALFPDHGSCASQLLAHADLAMYQAKSNGRADVVIFSKELLEASSRKLLRIEELRRAISNNELILHFQPQRNLRTGDLTGVEALVRWQHPTQGLTYPNEFIPLAEESGLILELGKKVLEMACQQARAWQDEGIPMKMAVNMSARQFQEEALTPMVSEVLANAGLDPSWLEIEITESLIMKDVDAAVARMSELTALGVELAIDDFGTGYSSLSMLKRFPLTRLKIDRSFISDIPRDRDDMAIVAAVISLAQKLELEVMAEGVESGEQAEFLLDAGCQGGQGYLFGHPVPPDEIRVFALKESIHRAA